MPLCATRAALPQCQSANTPVHPVLGHIDPDDNEIILCHHPLPSLLGSGSKPLQLFGLRKTPELSLALIQALSPLGATGSVPATGGWCATARWHTVTDFPDTRAQGRPGACCTRGLACDLRKQSCTRAYRAAGTLRPSLRNGFTAYFVLSPENGSFASVAAQK